MTTAIVAVVYLEPEYAQTRACLERTGLPVTWVDRKPAGVGSLARAYNEGFRRTSADLVWMVSNVTFPEGTVDRLADTMEANPEFGCIHPPFQSDWPWCHSDGADLREVPFVEFTAPLVRAEAFWALPLDERMPYWGHDMEWGLRARAAGWKVGVDHGAPELGHTYIRNSQPNPFTRDRRRRRTLSDAGTKRVLVGKYGRDWRATLTSGVP